MDFDEIERRIGELSKADLADTLLFVSGTLQEDPEIWDKYTEALRTIFIEQDQEQLREDLKKHNKPGQLKIYRKYKQMREELEIQITDPAIRHFANILEDAMNKCKERMELQDQIDQIEYKIFCAKKFIEQVRLKGEIDAG